MQTHYPLTGQQDPNVVLRQTKQQWELPGAIAFLHDHGRRHPSTQPRGFKAYQRSNACELEGNRQFMGQGFFSLLLKNPEQTSLLAETTAMFLVFLKVFPRHITGRALQLGQLHPQLTQMFFFIHQIQTGEVAAKAALHQLSCLG